MQIEKNNLIKDKKVINGNYVELLEKTEEKDELISKLRLDYNTLKEETDKVGSQSIMLSIVCVGLARQDGEPEVHVIVVLRRVKLHCAAAGRLGGDEQTEAGADGRDRDQVVPVRD